MSDVPLAMALDATPPVVRLVGEKEVEVAQFSLYVEAGAVAEDAVDGFLPVSVEGADLVDVERVGTYVVAYRATDRAGNAAPAQLRTVKVVDPCPSPSQWCPELGVCETCVNATSCACVAGLEATEAAAAAQRVLEYQPPKDLTVPVMILLGDGQHAVTAAGVRIMIHRLVVGQTFRDPGVLVS